MTTITFEEDIKLKQKKFKNIEEFMSKIAYEEQLEDKIQITKNSPKSDFINI